MRTAMIKVALASVLVAGCYTTRITSGTPPKTVAPMAQEQWHHSVVAGIAEISPPVDLEQLCETRGWAEIKEELTFLNGLVSAGTAGVYTPRTYSLTCGAGSSPAAEPGRP